MTHIENTFNSLLQRDLEFCIDGKIIKDGKLVLFCQNEFYLNFHLKGGSSDKKKYEIPYPFKVTRTDDDRLILDYSISAISSGDADIEYRLLALTKKAYSKLYGKCVEIREKNH